MTKLLGWNTMTILKLLLFLLGYSTTACFFVGTIQLVRAGQDLLHLGIGALLFLYACVSARFMFVCTVSSSPTASTLGCFDLGMLRPWKDLRAPILKKFIFIHPWFHWFHSNHQGDPLRFWIV